MSEIESPSLPEGVLIGRYRVMRRIGVGSFGEVYEARHEDLERRCALKVIQVPLTGNDEIRARFVREARAAAGLQHPHIVTVLDFGIDGDTLFIAMEFLEGESLGQRLFRGPMQLTEAADVMLPVASALAAAHKSGVVHRDLKPDNIMLTRPRTGGAVHPTLIDFGLAKVRSERKKLTAANILVGTPTYASPEQVRESQNIDHRADQWAFGIMLFEMVTGTKVFAPGQPIEVINRVLSAEIPTPGSRNAALPPAFDRLVGRMLQRLPDLRFPDMRAVGAELLPFASPGMQARFAEEFGAEVAEVSLRASQVPPEPVRRVSLRPSPSHPPPKPPVPFDGSLNVPMHKIPRWWLYAGALAVLAILLTVLAIKA